MPSLFRTRPAARPESAVAQAPALSAEPRSDAVSVYYNSTCPVCRSGIALHKRELEATEHSVSVTFVDVSQQTDVLSRDGITFDQVRRHMYVRDANGRLHRGTDAFAVLWAAHPRRRWMARAVMLPVIRPIARWSYDRFADMLYNWNRQHKRW